MSRINGQGVNLSRRRFLVTTSAAGAGLSLGMMLPGCARASAEFPDEINAWVVVNPDNSVVVRIARAEMGQGTLTGLAQLVAEELECNWDLLGWEWASTQQSVLRGRPWKNFATGGSRGIRESQQYLREGGAAARMMLVEAAAARWQVAPTQCSVAQGVITNRTTGETLTFGAVAAAAAQLPPPLEVRLKDPKDWTLIGQPVKRLDTRGKLDGSQMYGSDVALPGMLNASIAACPVFGGTLKHHSAEPVEKMPGVQGVVAVGDNAVAVVADTWWRANKALKALAVEWDLGDGAALNQDEIEQRLTEGLTAETKLVGNQSGDLHAALQKADRVVEATYSYPYLNHATMEPMNATARWTRDFCEVWCPTQNGEAAHAAAAAAAGLPPHQVDVHRMVLGGGFGRRGAQDYVTQAVEIARAFPGRPVKLLWTREEDMTHGFYHPITKARAVAGLDADGNLQALHMRISGQSILAGILPQALQNGLDFATFQALLPSGDHAISYSVPNLLVDHAMRNTHIRPGFWRGVNVNPNAILHGVLHGRTGACGRDRSAGVPQTADARQSAGLGGAQRRRDPGRMVEPRAARQVSRPVGVQGIRQLRRRLRTSVRRPGAPHPHRAHHGGDGSRLLRQPAASRGAGGRLVRVRAERPALWRVHGRQRQDRAGELSYLPLPENRADAGG